MSRFISGLWLLTVLNVQRSLIQSPLPTVGKHFAVQGVAQLSSWDAACVALFISPCQEIISILCMSLSKSASDCFNFMALLSTRLISIRRLISILLCHNPDDRTSLLLIPLIPFSFHLTAIVVDVSIDFSYQPSYHCLRPLQ